MYWFNVSQLASWFEKQSCVGYLLTSFHSLNALINEYESILDVTLL